MNYLEDKKYVTEIDTKYNESIVKLGELLHLSIKVADNLKNDEAKNYIKYGVGRRLSYLKETTERFYNVALLEINCKEVDDDTRFNQTALLSFFFFNVSGALDNLAWVYAEELEFNYKSHFEVSFKNNKFNKALPKAVVEVLSSHADWLKTHVKGFRDASAHRILPYIPPYIEIEGTSEKVFCSYYTHDFNTAPMVPFHPQVLCDVMGLIEILEVGLTSLKDLKE